MFWHWQDDTWHTAGGRVSDRNSAGYKPEPKASWSSAGIQIQQKTNKITVLKAFVRADVFSFHTVMEISHMWSQVTLFVNLHLCHITHCVERTEAKALNEVAAREREVLQYDHENWSRPMNLFKLSFDKWCLYNKNMHTILRIRVLIMCCMGHHAWTDRTYVQEGENSRETWWKRSHVLAPSGLQWIENEQLNRHKERAPIR